MVLALKSSGWVLPRLLESEHPEPQPVGHKLGAIRQQLRLGDVLVVLRRPNALVQGGLGGRGGDSEQSRLRRIPRMRRRLPGLSEEEWPTYGHSQLKAGNGRNRPSERSFPNTSSIRQQSHALRVYDLRLIKRVQPLCGTEAGTHRVLERLRNRNNLRVPERATRLNS